MALQPLPRCPTCGSGTEHAFDLPGRAVVRCVDRRCTLHFCHPQPDDEVLAALYRADFAPGAPEGHGSTPPAYARALVAALTRETGMLAGRRVLDFGAGIGTISAALRDAGADVVAVETSPEGRGELRHRTGIVPRTDLGEIEQMRFSLIVMVEVIEHVRNPRVVLERLRATLEPGGALFVTTPNLASLRARIEGSGWPNVAAAPHLFYFTRRSLRRTLELAGFPHIKGVRHAGRHPELPLRRQLLQAALRPFGLDGGLQVLAVPGPAWVDARGGDVR